ERMNLDKPLGEIFVEEGYVTAQQLAALLASREDTTESVGNLMVRHGLITEKQKLKCLGLQSGVPFVDLASVPIDANAGRWLVQTVAVRLMSVPIDVTEVAATVAMANPLDLEAIDELSAELGVDVDPMWATEEDIREAIYRVYGSYDDLDDLVASVARDL